jgi:hypothetical protein
VVALERNVADTRSIRSPYPMFEGPNAKSRSFLEVAFRVKCRKEPRRLVNRVTLRRHNSHGGNNSMKRNNTQIVAILVLITLQVDGAL